MGRRRKWGPGDAVVAGAGPCVHLSALAAVAATGAAFAQTVTLSGKLAFGYEANQAWSTGAKTNGLQVTDGDFVLGVTEDLGAGLKASADMAVKSRGRGTSIEGRDAKISLSGGFGTVTIGAIEAANGILGLGGAGAPTLGLDNNSFAATFPTGITTNAGFADELDDLIADEDFDGALSAVTTYISKVGVLDAASNIDLLSYTTPSFGGFTARVMVVEASNGTGGSEKASLTQDGIVVGGSYAAGPLAASVDYTKFGKNSATGSAAVFNAIADTRTRLSASYDLGVAKLGAGYQMRDWTNTGGALGDNTQYVLGVTVPMGAFTFGYNYGGHKQETALGDVTAKGHDIAVNYALSKRTSLRAAYQTYAVKFDGEKVGSNNTRTQVRLMHSF